MFSAFIPKNHFYKLLVLLFALSSGLTAQNNMWVWMNGTNTTNDLGSYGSMGFPAPGNMPGARYEASEWTDNNGKFWLYGGYETVNGNQYNDLWKYDPVTNQWAWMNGPNVPTNNASFGTMGVPSPTNNPGPRKYGSVTWCDNNNNLWLMGGFGPSGAYADMWEYLTASNQWVWMKGPSTAFPNGSYGTQGVAAAANNPSYRFECSASWVDNAGDLWFFGGQGNGNFNDLWRFNIASNNWTWMNGSQYGSATGNWGTLGVTAPTNVPSGRMVYASWKDLTGDFWIFGGNDSSYFGGGGMRNDLWKYDLPSNQWTWMSGSSTFNQPGVYGTQCTASASNVPPSKLETRSRWTDDCGNLWLFGGARDIRGALSQNDLWKYNTTTNQWTWVSGATIPAQPSVYGTMTVPAAANHPGARMGAVSWKNNSGLWVWGGAAGNPFTYYNDLWKYIPDKPTAAFTMSPTSGCAPLIVTFTNTSLQNCSDIMNSSWDFGDPGSGAANTSVATSPTHTFATPGTYTIKLVVQNCFGIKDSITHNITTTAGFTYTTGSTQASCAGSTGTATATPTSGTAPYTYSWSTGGSTQTIGSLSAGTYTVTVTETGGCSQTQTVSVTQSAGIVENLTPTSATCGSNNGSATVAASGGSGALTYSWSPSGGTGTTASGLAAGTYTCTITDATGCITSTTTVVSASGGPTVTLASQNNLLCNGGSNATATVSATGGTSPYTYSWSPSGGNAAMGINLSAGAYTCTVQDANACSQTYTVTITQPTAITGTTTPTNASCSGSGGSASITASGGTGTLTYSWSPIGGSGTTATNLSPFTYTCYVTDANGCSQGFPVTINTTPSPSITLNTQTNENCNGASTGAATFTAASGTAPYTYSWSPSGGTAATATGLTAGTYTITVKDAGGCTNTQTVTITQPGAITATSTFSNTVCGGSTGTATVTASGGTGTLTYNWTPSGGTASTANNLAAGTYTCNITDASGCSKPITLTINSTGGPTITVASQSNPLCNGGTTGSATITASAGTGPYTYSWTPSGGTAATANNLAAGTYTITVKDAGGCSTAQTVTLSSPTAITASSVVVNAGCGGNNGSVTITASGGTGALSYSWTPSGGNAATATALAPGTYTCTIKDVNGCTHPITATVGSNGGPTTTLASQINDACNGGATGTATVSVGGGTAPYTYSWNTVPPQTTATGANLAAGTYTCTVKDAGGCSQTITVTITQPSVLNVHDTSGIFCGTNSGHASCTVSGGTGPYTYSWSPSGGNTAVATGLATGTYTCTVKDAAGCTKVSSIGVQVITTPFATVSPNVTILQGTGTTLVATGGGTYLWSPALGLSCDTCKNTVATPLSTTAYCVRVKDTFGCIDSACVDVTVDQICGTVFVPNFFSPNGDGKNDQLCVYGNCIKTITFVIFDRWGEKVFETEDPLNVCWDGIYKGEMMNSAVFAYTLTGTLQSGAAITGKGNISLVR